MFGVVKVRTPMMPNGTAVHSSQGRNLPQRVVVRSAITPITGLRQATPRPTTRNSVPACAAVSPKVCGVEVQLQGQQRLKNKVRGHVAQAVSELLSKGKFLRSLLPRLSPASGRLTPSPGA